VEVVKEEPSRAVDWKRWMIEVGLGWFEPARINLGAGSGNSSGLTSALLRHDLSLQVLHVQNNFLSNGAENQQRRVPTLDCGLTYHVL
jgi:hypothetical protein